MVPLVVGEGFPTLCFKYFNRLFFPFKGCPLYDFSRGGDITYL
jgi:hypothetical protein